MKTKLLTLTICIVTLFSVNLAYGRYPISPYAYTNNNPIKYIDPDGRDVYRFDEKTGDFHLAVKNDDKFDQVGKFKQNKETGEYSLVTNKKGEARTKIDNIEKGILNDGINFKENDNVIAVGGENQPSISGVENFVVELGEMVSKEIGGYYLSEKGQNTADRMYISKYKNNTQTKAYPYFSYSTPGTPSKDNIVFQANFHTHPSGIPSTDPTKPSDQDYSFKGNQTTNGIKKFFILTRGHLPILY